MGKVNYSSTNEYIMSETELLLNQCSLVKSGVWLEKGLMGSLVKNQIQVLHRVTGHRWTWNKQCWEGMLQRLYDYALDREKCVKAREAGGTSFVPHNSSNSSHQAFRQASFSLLDGYQSDAKQHVTNRLCSCSLLVMLERILG